MPREKLATRMERGITEVEKLVRERHPEAEFKVPPRRPGSDQVIVEVYGNFEDQTDLSEIVSDRSVDLLLETGLLFIPVARPYTARPTLKHQKTA